jgi:hypothetical protein
VLYPPCSLSCSTCSLLYVRVHAAVNGNPYGPFSDPLSTNSFQKLFSYGARSFSIYRLDTPNNKEVWQGPHASAATWPAWGPNCVLCILHLHSNTCRTHWALATVLTRLPSIHPDQSRGC